MGKDELKRSQVVTFHYLPCVLEKASFSKNYFELAKEIIFPQMTNFGQVELIREMFRTLLLSGSAANLCPSGFGLYELKIRMMR